jgi:hypothetical protein
VPVRIARTRVLTVTGVPSSSSCSESAGYWRSSRSKVSTSSSRRALELGEDGRHELGVAVDVEHDLRRREVGVAEGRGALGHVDLGIGEALAGRAAQVGGDGLAPEPLPGLEPVLDEEVVRDPVQLGEVDRVADGRQPRLGVATAAEGP